MIMINLYNEVSRDIKKIPECIKYFETELNNAKEINNGIEVLIDNNLDNDNYYLNK